MADQRMSNEPAGRSKPGGISLGYDVCRYFRLLPPTECLEESRENMARKDKVLTHYREQLKLNEDALRGHAEGRNDDKEVAKLKHSIAKLKAIIQAHEQKVKHG